MKVSYKKLWIKLAENEMSKAKMRELTGISSGTLTKLNKGEEVSMSVLLRICDAFKCDIGDICEVVKPKVDIHRATKNM